MISLIAMISEPTVMSSITIRNLEESVKRKLRVRAARHGRSMEQEVREILRVVLADRTQPPTTNLFDAIRRRLAPVGGVELAIPARGPMREPPRFEE
jgi:plasmid stability protein